jgi:hypothetical protein
MGEYARFNGQEIKIGTCEDMLYLRADQAHLVTPQSGSVDPIADAEHLRFRFPWPHEDGTEPGAFKDADKAVGLYGLTPPEGVEHYSVQFTARGYNVSLPCPEGPDADKIPFKVHRNGFPGSVMIVQQRLWEGNLVLVCQCGGCGARYRLPTIEDVRPVVEACIGEADVKRRAGDESGARWWMTVAERIAAGYTNPPTFKREPAKPILRVVPKPEPEAPKAEQPVHLDRDETISRIRAALKKRSGKAWSVTGGRGTAWGWISIDAPPKRRTNGGNMTAADQAELATLLGLEHAHCQGVSIPAGYDYRAEYVDRAEGRKPSVCGTPYWD